MTTFDWDNLYKTLNALIQSGKSLQARQQLEELELTQVPRKSSIPFATLCYRVGIPFLGLRILRRIENPTDSEKAEYAFGLTRIGAEEEALKLLLSLNASDYSPILLYRSGIHISRWEYEAAIPLLIKYSEVSGISKYERVVAQVNLAASLNYAGRFNAAGDVLEEIKNISAKEEYFFAMGKALQLEAEAAFYQKQWDHVGNILNEAKKYIQDHKGLDDFFIRKLGLQYELEKSKGDPKVVSKIKELQKEAYEKRHWETIRDCDKSIAVITKDETLYKKLYFGTPFARFRKQLEKDFGSSVELENSFDWILKEGKNASVLDLSETPIGSGKNKLSKGNLLYNVLRFATVDFYRPFRVASLHNHLYPNLKFDMTSSRPRIHRALARMREWLDAVDSPLQIQEVEEFYLLRSESPLTIRVPLISSVSKKEAGPIEELESQFSENPFSTSDASKVLKKPLRTVSRILLEAMQEGTITRAGKGPSTKYCFKKKA